MNRENLVDKIDIILAVLRSGNIESGKAMLEVLRDMIEREDVMSDTVKKMYTLLDIISGKGVNPKYKTPEMIEREVTNAEFRRDAAREEKLVGQWEADGCPDLDEGDK
jgi:hypothetical protein